MKTFRLPILFTFLAASTLSMALYVSGCKESTSEPEQGVPPITDDLFPLVVGHKLVFSGFIRDAVTDLNIDATGAVYEGRMTITSNASPTPLGGTATLLLDSSRVPTGIANPPTIWVQTPFYIQRPSPSGSGDFAFLTNIGRFYRQLGLNRADSLRWVLLVKQTAGVGVEWTAFDSTWTAPTGLVRLQIVGKIDARASLTVGGQTFNPYKVTATRKIYLGGSATPSTTGTTAEIWLEPAIGIVKFIYHSDGETPGFYREYKSRNF